MFALLFLLLILPKLFALQLPNESVEDLGGDWYLASTWIVMQDDMTLSEVKEQATSKALKNIIEYYSGIEISSSSLSILAESNTQMSMDHFSEVSNTMSSGMILEKEVLEGKLDQYNNQFLYTTIIKARVGKLKGERDPLFIVTAKLNRDHYQDGDEMSILIKSSKRCYIYVFNVYSDGTVSTLIPNDFTQENLINTGGEMLLPPKDGKISKWRVGLPAGKKSATELIYILAIKADEGQSSTTFDLNLESYNLAIKELTKFIIDFPRDQIEQVTLTYVIEDRN